MIRRILAFKKEPLPFKPDITNKEIDNDIGWYFFLQLACIRQQVRSNRIQEPNTTTCEIAYQLPVGKTMIS
jgi:hypothetical protein